MPLLIALRALLVGVTRGALTVVRVSFWPMIRGWAVRFLTWTGIITFFKYVAGFIGLQVASGLFDTAIRGLVVWAMLLAWAAFLFVMCNFSALDVIKEAFSANPFADVSVFAGALYLASHAFPFHMLFGTMFAYMLWRISLLQAALVFNRTVVFLKAGVKF